MQSCVVTVWSSFILSLDMVYDCQKVEKKFTLNEKEIQMSLLLKKKKKFSQVHFKDRIGFIERFVNGAASHLARRGHLQRATERDRLLKARQRVLKRIILGLGNLPAREGRGLCVRYSIFLQGMERALVIGDLIGADREIPDRPVKATSLETEPSMRWIRY